MNSLLRTIGLSVSLSLHVPWAIAGESSQATETVLPGAAITRLAAKVERTAADAGARVFLIARQGRPQAEMPEGILYTHTAIAVYSLLRDAQGRGRPAYVVHNLYQRQDNPDRSSLVTDLVPEFVRGARTPRIGIAIPSAALQAKLLEVMMSDAPRRLHNENYSAVANPFTVQYQNCTEHVLDIIQTAIYGPISIAEIKVANRTYFQPQMVRIPGLVLAFAAVFSSGIATDDSEGPVQTTTYGSLVHYLHRNGMLEHALEIEI